MPVNASYDLLSSLLPTAPFALAYALPLLLVSILLTFAGAFLTLDRTRVFPSDLNSRQTTQSNKHSWLAFASWTSFLRGGLGGLCSGYTFGVYLTTLLALLIPNTTTSSQLGPKSFLAVWIVAAIVCMTSSGRWKYVTFFVCGTTGFATTALSISVIAHPTLTTRIALLAVLATLGTVLCMLPFSGVRRVSIRFAGASAGSFGLVVCTAILRRSLSWGNVWERVWLRDGDHWGTSDEKGLSAAYCLLLCAGFISDTLLHHKFGENPDEKWDRYLAKIADNLPNEVNRAGTFTPFVSLYERILGRNRDFIPIVPDEKVSPPPLPSEKSQTIFDVEASLPLDNVMSHPGFLRKKGNARIKGAPLGREPVKFQPGDEQSPYSSDEEDYDVRPSVPRSMSTSSSTTLTNSQAREGHNLLGLPRGMLADIPDYSDCEDDLGLVGKDKASRDDPNWTPQFIRRSSPRTHIVYSGPLAHNDIRLSSPSWGLSGQSLPMKQTSYAVTPSPNLRVPATPSLIRAVDRITAAYAAQGTPNPPADGLPSFAQTRRDTVPWDTFWADVKAKAQA
ncbi:hypothetical protein PHLGIDRAFT_19716 [Phlebiopsis gigantea 11061_1 CR5-6]|uniref:DUF4203 domain-containing protein n=1 Tax=Phlebiopsis gigantea (strain 11061_1 CR5-6) TaxID=745531 RepID=A0A0C3RVL6_PHLG1|nr:hypothetical protein PHLGIDRAFT_19716 [Phlebiopsis gigantea 11061_1 CR5-6]